MAGLQTIGQSGDGTDMRVIQICRGGDCDNGKPDMYIEGGIHARKERSYYSLSKDAHARLGPEWKLITLNC